MEKRTELTQWCIDNSILMETIHPFIPIALLLIFLLGVFQFYILQEETKKDLLFAFIQVLSIFVFSFVILGIIRGMFFI